MDNRRGPFAFVIDKEVVDKTQTVDKMRCFKYVTMMIVGFLLNITALSVVNGDDVTFNIFFFIVAAILLLYLFVRDVFYKKNIMNLYTDIREQWSTEKKVSDRHDEEVVFIRGVDDTFNVTLILIAWVISCTLIII